MGKVYILVPSISGGGGAERTACLLANGLSEYYQVEVLAMSTKEPMYELNAKAKYIKIDDKIIKAQNFIIRNINRIRFLVKKCRDEHPDLVIGYTIQGGIIACIVARFIKIRTIVCERQDPKQFGRLQRVIRDFLYKSADGAVFQTIEAQNYFSKIVHNSTVIPNFIDNEKLPVVRRFSDRSNIICSAGRLEYAKNQEMLIKAFCNIMNDYPHYVLNIWGEGALRGKLEELVREKKAEQRVFLCGRTNEIFEELSESKIFVLSSNYEGYPNALLEAMALGNACVSTDCPCGGPRDMIQDGINGYLIPVGNVDMLEKTLRTLLDNEDNMQEIAHKAMKKQLSNGKMAILKKWFAYIDSIMREK